MKGIFKMQYRKTGGKLVFVYELDGTPEQLAEYKKIKGDHHREDEKTKKSLFFANRFGGKEVSVIKTKDEKDFTMDTTEMDLLGNLTQQYGYEMAKDILAKTTATE